MNTMRLVLLRLCLSIPIAGVLSAEEASPPLPDAVPPDVVPPPPVPLKPVLGVGAPAPAPAPTPTPTPKPAAENQPPPPAVKNFALGPDVKLILGKDVAGWLAHLKGHDIHSERRLAIYCLGEFGPAAAAAVPELRERLKDVTDDSARWLSAEVLGQIGTEAGAALPELLAALKENQAAPKLRRASLEALARIAPESLEVSKAVQAALRDSDEDVRHAALDACVTLAFFGSNESKSAALPALKRALAEPADAEAASIALRCLGPAGTEPLLDAFTRGREAGSRKAALEALARMGLDAKGAREALLAAAKKEKEPEIRAAVLETLAEQCATDDAMFLAACTNTLSAALGRGEDAEKAEAFLAKGGTAAASVLKPLFKIKNSEVKAAAARAAAGLGASATALADDLIPLLEDKSPATVQAAVEACTVLGPAASGARGKLEALRAKAPASLRTTIELALANLERPAGSAPLKSARGGRSTEELLSDLANSPDAALRVEAAELLAERPNIGAHSAFPRALLAAFEDKDEHVRGAAAAALGVCGATARVAYPKFTEWLRNGSEAEKLGVLRALGRLKETGNFAAPESADLVLALGEFALSPAVDLTPEQREASEKPALYRAYAQALQAVNEPLTPILNQAIKNPDAETEMRAAQALGHLGQAALPALKHLLEMTLDPEERVASTAILALRDLGPLAKAALPRLFKLLPLENLRRRNVLKAIDAIGVDMHDPEIKERMNALLVALLDSDEKTGWEAQLVFIGIGEPGWLYLRQAINALPDEPPPWALRALAAQKADPKSVIPLLGRLTWPGMSTDERIVAADLLGSYARVDAAAIIPYLTRLLSDRNEDIARVAGRSLKILGEPAIPELNKLLHGRDPRARRNALNVLEEIRRMNRK